MRLYDLVMHGAPTANLALVDSIYDPVSDSTILAEAQVCETLDIWMDRKTAILLDFRTTLFTHHINPRWNTGLIICSNVIEKNTDHWYHKHHSGRAVYYLAECRIQKTDDFLTLKIDFTLSVTCGRIEFFFGHVTGIDDLERSLNDGLESYLKGFAHWESEIELLNYSHIAVD